LTSIFNFQGFARFSLVLKRREEENQQIVVHCFSLYFATTFGNQETGLFSKAEFIYNFSLMSVLKKSINQGKKSLSYFFNTSLSGLMGMEHEKMDTFV